ncbi:S-layer protein [Candidatus Woesearchaeota archaeon]|nr:S-layer protein [Candidatus Woesearchaeota archaeon]
MNSMHIVSVDKGETFSLPAKELDPVGMRALAAPLAQEILKRLAERPSYPVALARELKLHEQKVYYHIRKLLAAGLIKVVSMESRHGATAKLYAAVEPGFVVRFAELEPSPKLTGIEERHRDFLEPFIVDGRLEARIIVGSPDPHGPDKARSRDGYYGMDLALFLGTFLSYVPKLYVMLDTETKEEDLTGNLIVIGGPVVNKVTERLNALLPVRFDATTKAVHSTVTGNDYLEDEIGIIVRIANPFAGGKAILVVAGKRYAGTRAAIMAFLKGFGRIVEGNLHKKGVMAKVVQGLDLDSDGIVDDVEFRE